MEIRAEFPVIFQEKISRNLHRRNVLFPVPSVRIGLGGCRLLLRTEVQVHVEAATEHEGKTFAEGHVELGISIHPVAQLRVDTLIRNEVGIVLSARKAIVLLEVFHSRKPIILHPRHIHVRRISPKAVHHGGRTITGRRRDIVTLLSLVSYGSFGGHPVGQFVACPERNILFAVIGIGNHHVSTGIAECRADGVLSADFSRNRQ